MGVSVSEKRDDLLFCRVERGECHLLRPELRAGATTAGGRLRSDSYLDAVCAYLKDPTMEPEDSEDLVAAAKSVSLQLGEGTEAPVTLRGGRFVFDTANESSAMGAIAIVAARCGGRYVVVTRAVVAEVE